MVEMNRVERLWALAELEAGLEHSKLDREPMFGSEEVVNKITETCATDQVKEHNFDKPVIMEVVGDELEHRLTFQDW